METPATICIGGSVYELCGDSLLLRLWKYANGDTSNMEKIAGAVRSGATMEDICEQLNQIRTSRSLEPNVLVIVGTNNLLQTFETVSLENLQRLMERVLSELRKTRAKGIFLCTVPPTPRLGYRSLYLRVWKDFNLWLLELQGADIVVLNLGKVFFYFKRRNFKYQYFEDSYRNGEPDMVYWNNDGMEVALEHLQDHLG